MEGTSSGGGNNSAIIAVLVVVVIAAVGYFAYTQGFLGGKNADKEGVDINLPGGDSN